jgi:DNA-binding SARP family transcriptional activator
MVEHLRLLLLGGLHIIRCGTPVPGFVSRKVPALLCYLAVTGRPHLRAELAGLLWGELPDAAANANLRQALCNLRHLLAPYLLIAPQTVEFNRDSPYWLDVEVLQSRSNPRAAWSDADIDLLGEAVEHYQGEFLQGFHVRDALAFEEWVLGQREHWRQIALQALHTLAAYFTAQDNVAEAVRYSTRLLALEPWQEQAHRQMMQLLTRSGRREAALAQYETCRRVLVQELGVEPMPETTRLYEQIREGAFIADGGDPHKTSPSLGQPQVADKTIDHLRQASQQAAQEMNHSEAVLHLRRALKLLNTLPDTPQRDRRELALQLDLALPLQAVKGYGDLEVGRLYSRMWELCKRLDESPPQLYTALWYLTSFHLAQGEFQTARATGQEFISLAEHSGEPLHVALAHLAMGWTLVYLGELSQARAHLERALDLYHSHPLYTWPPEPDVRVIGLLNLSLVLWLMGYPRQAHLRCLAALALAQTPSHSLTLALALAWASIFHVIWRDLPAALALGEACTRLATEHKFSHWLAVGLYSRGWALAELGQPDQAIGLIYSDVVGAQSMGEVTGQTFRMAALAQVCAKTGQREQSLALLDEALAAAHHTGEHFFEPEIYRLKGELSLRDAETAAACFKQAIEIAQRQQARSWELRAMTSLCRLGRTQAAQDEQKEWRDKLAVLYAGFTEGHDTADLREAKALLDEIDSAAHPG